MYAYCTMYSHALAGAEAAAVAAAIGAFRAAAAAASRAVTLGGRTLGDLTPRNAFGTAGMSAAWVHLWPAQTMPAARRKHGALHARGARARGRGAHTNLGEQSPHAVRRLCADGEPVLDALDVEGHMLAPLCISRRHAGSRPDVRVQ